MSDKQKFLKSPPEPVTSQEADWQAEMLDGHIDLQRTCIPLPKQRE